jgi:periplasmic protein TonB
MIKPFTIVLLTALWATPRPGLSQVHKHEKIVYLDDDGNPAKEKKATMLHQTIQLNDTLWEHNFYHQHGHCISSIRCSDAKGNVLNGRFVSYSLFGTVDTVGDYSKGRRTGQWSFYTPTGRLLGYQMYQDGAIRWAKDSLQIQYEKDSLKEQRKKDSLDGKKIIEIESAFPGGARAWLGYLNINLRYPDDDVNRGIQGTVVVDFVVDSTGHIPESSVWVSRSIEFAIDKEAIRIVQHSPVWVPAIQDGRMANSFKQQPIVFKHEDFSR